MKRPSGAASPCPVCGQARSHGPCPNNWCRRRDRGFSVAFSVGVHQGALRRAIRRYKYEGQRHLAEVFARMTVAYVQSHPLWFEEFDVVAAVPSYTGPGARRRWDPVGEILTRMADPLGPGWQVAPAAVVKDGETPRMAGLCWWERQKVARGPLRQALRVPEAGVVAGRQVLVLDDVMTEGSTLREVARTLRRAGAAEVAGLVLARPPWSAGPNPRRPDPTLAGPPLLCRVQPCPID